MLVLVTIAMCDKLFTFDLLAILVLNNDVKARQEKEGRGKRGNECLGAHTFVALGSWSLELSRASPACVPFGAPSCSSIAPHGPQGGSDRIEELSVDRYMDQCNICNAIDFNLVFPSWTGWTSLCAKIKTRLGQGNVTGTVNCLKQSVSFPTTPRYQPLRLWPRIRLFPLSLCSSTQQGADREKYLDCSQGGAENYFQICKLTIVL